VAKATFLAGTFPKILEEGTTLMVVSRIIPVYLDTKKQKLSGPNNSKKEEPNKDHEIENGILKFVNIAVNIVTEGLFLMWSFKMQFQDVLEING